MFFFAGGSKWYIKTNDIEWLWGIWIGVPHSEGRKKYIEIKNNGPPLLTCSLNCVYYYFRPTGQAVLPGRTLI